MQSYRPVLALVIVVLLLVGVPLRFADALIGYGPPAADNYMREDGPDSRHRDARCAASGMRLVTPGPGSIWTGAGSDQVSVGMASSVRLFDSASDETGDEHDMLVIRDVRPSDIRTAREGAHLLICGVQVPLSVVVFRQYCHDTAEGGRWNNRIEEIVFTSASEIWIADELLDAAENPSDIASLTRIDESKEGKAALAKFSSHWRVRPFSDVLPSAWLSSLACRRDLVGPAGKDAP